VKRRRVKKVGESAQANRGIILKKKKAGKDSKKGKNRKKRK